MLAIAIACFSVPRMLLPNNPAKSDNKLLFDGVCNLCDGYVLGLMYATITQDTVGLPNHTNWQLLMQICAHCDGQRFGTPHSPGPATKTQGTYDMM